MIKIKSWFPATIREEYLDEMLLRIGVEIELNNFIDPKDREDYKKRFSELRKKELDNTLSNAEENEYKQYFLAYKKSIYDAIEFLPGKTIDLKTLLIGTRKEVIEEVDGIKEYLKLCRFIKKYSSGYSRSEFLKYLHDFYPDIIKYENNGTEWQYNLNGNTITDSELKSRKRNNLDKMNPFYYFYFDKSEISPCDKTKKYSYKDFQSVVKKATKNLHSATKDIKYSLISDDIRHRLLASLNIKCCPYCNRQYITSWHDGKNSVHSTADLDHFYQKTTYPLFALSLFNFVPSCQICNSRMKGGKEKETLYPYEESMDEFRFRCMPKDSGYDDLVDLWLANKTNDPNKLYDLYKLQFVYDSDDDADKKHIERINGSREVFCLDEVYQTHVDAAINEMLKIRIYYSGDYYKYACKTLQELGIVDANKNGFSEDEMRDIILGFVYNGQDKMDQPLRKMMSDILEYELMLRKIYNNNAGSK